MGEIYSHLVLGRKKFILKGSFVGSNLCFQTLHPRVKPTFYLLDLLNVRVLLLLVALARLHPLLGFVQHYNLAQQQRPCEQNWHRG